VISHAADPNTLAGAFLTSFSRMVADRVDWAAEQVAIDQAGRRQPEEADWRA
jgi:hypothetical protein